MLSRRLRRGKKPTAHLIGGRKKKKGRLLGWVRRRASLLLHFCRKEEKKAIPKPRKK